MKTMAIQGEKTGLACPVFSISPVDVTNYYAG